MAAISASELDAPLASQLPCSGSPHSSRKIANNFRSGGELTGRTLTMKTFIGLAPVMIISAACASLPAPSPQADTIVNASFATTWAAVLDRFAQSNIPIKAIDRSSGLITAEATRLDDSGRQYGNCNRMGIAIVPPDGATFNVLVKGDSIRSFVRATADWIGHNSKGLRLSCVTSGKWEQEFESAIKDQAESR
jgi:hypothetical protein